MKIKIITILLVVWSGVLCAQPSSNQTLEDVLKKFPSIKHSPAHQVLVIGSFHFNRKRDGSDVISKNHLNISSKENQRQIKQLIAQIKAFKPTQIAVEWRPNRQKKLDSLYQQSYY